MTTTAPAVRIARHRGTCSAPGCVAGIWPGAPIVQSAPGASWKHLDCSDPGKRTREDREEERAALARGRRIR